MTQSEPRRSLKKGGIQALKQYAGGKDQLGDRMDIDESELTSPEGFLRFQKGPDDNGDDPLPPSSPPKGGPKGGGGSGGAKKIIEDAAEKGAKAAIDKVAEETAAENKKLERKRGVLQRRKDRLEKIKSKGNPFTNIGNIGAISMLFPSVAGAMLASGTVASSISKIRQGFMEGQIDVLEKDLKKSGGLEKADSSEDVASDLERSFDDIDDDSEELLDVQREALERITNVEDILARTLESEEEAARKAEIARARGIEGEREAARKSGASGALVNKPGQKKDDGFLSNVLGAPGAFAGKLVSYLGTALGAGFFMKLFAKGGFLRSIGLVAGRFAALLGPVGMIISAVTILGPILWAFRDDIAELGKKLWDWTLNVLPDWVKGTFSKIGDGFMNILHKAKNFVMGDRQYRQDDFVPRYANEEYYREKKALEDKKSKIESSQRNSRTRTRNLQAVDSDIAKLNKKYDQAPEGGDNNSLVPASSIDIETTSNLQRLGSISAKYESGDLGVRSINRSLAATDGVAYGKYQLATKTGTMQDFLKSIEGAGIAKKYGLDSAKPGTKEFDKRYMQAVTEDSAAMEKAQHDYIKRTHYKPVESLAASMGFDTKHPAIQEALFSQSVQTSFDGNKAILEAANPNGDVYDQIKSIYQARSDYVSGLSSVPENIKKGVQKRYSQESATVTQYAQNVEKMSARDTIKPPAMRSTMLDTSTVTAQAAERKSEKPVTINQGDVIAPQKSGKEGGNNTFINIANDIDLPLRTHLDRFNMYAGQ